MKTVYLNAPVTAEDLRTIEAGDRVILSGTVYTARDQAHRKMAEALDRGEELPFPLEGSAIYYAGPTPEPEGKPIGSCGPTTSGRMDVYSPRLLDLGNKIMIGKGQRNEAVREAIVRNGAVYLAAVGGAGALMASCIRSAETVAWPELGCEALRKLTFDQAELRCVIDSEGNDYYITGPEKWRKEGKKMKLGFGLMRLPVLEGGEIDLEQFKKMADDFMAAGGTYFDTAYVYHGGKSEVAFREAVVKRYPREAFTVTDKLPMFLIKEAAEMERIFSEQLERCGVDYFDYYWLHSLENDTYELSEKLNAFDFICRKKAEGKVKHVGFSFHDSPAVLEKILKAHPEMEFVQLQLNYLDWDDPNVASGANYEVATRYGKPVIVMEPIRGGALAALPEDAEKLFRTARPDLSVASWAVRFAASPDNVMMVLSGMSNTDQMTDNLSYMTAFQPLSAEEQAVVGKALESVRNAAAISCTGCRYCTDGCPMQIKIPDFFANYNYAKRFRNQEGRMKAAYNRATKDSAKASDCLECGACEEVCPQHLPIRELLKTVAATFEK